MEGFLDRIEERSVLERFFNAEKAGFGILYGRRRIGKSSLLRYVLGKEGVYFLADMSDKSLQIKNFAEAIARVVPDFDKASYPTWYSLFAALENSVSTRINIAIDEFPYMVNAAPELPSELQKIIDLGRKSKYNLVICGSSQQMMRELFLGITSPLYGRADVVMNVSALKIHWLKAYLNCSATDAVKEYAVWGGVPRYWEIRKSHKSHIEAIKMAILDKNGVLLEEPMRLFLDDMRSAVQAYSIVNLVGNGKHRLSEIANMLEKPATHFSRPLANLVEMGYLKREIPFGDTEANSKKGMYWIADPFLNFYMKLVASNKSIIELGLWDVLKTKLDTELPHLYGKVWEDLARYAVPYLKLGEIDWNKAYRYWGKTNVEVDLVAESIDKTSILVGEVKWSNSEIDIKYVTKQLDENAAFIASLFPSKKIVKAIFVPDRSMCINKNDTLLVDCEEVVSILK